MSLFKPRTPFTLPELEENSAPIEDRGIRLGEG
ncbi:hypothetical protein ALQ79_200763 [Pseudomonas amygdali pv. lachrymans]|nr:hypothetical protein ALQ79_200763 [Pseudomonas amygdali pv. lachrymans]